MAKNTSEHLKKPSQFSRFAKKHPPSRPHFLSNHHFLLKEPLNCQAKVHVAFGVHTKMTKTKLQMVNHFQ